MSSESLSRAAVMCAASKKLPIVSDKKLTENLEWAADSLADAYRIGAEEAQAEIIGRLIALSKPAAPRSR